MPYQQETPQRKPGDKYYYLLEERNYIPTIAQSKLLKQADEWENNHKVLHRMFSTCYLENMYVATVLFCCETEQD